MAFVCGFYMHGFEYPNRKGQGKKRVFLPLYMKTEV